MTNDPVLIAYAAKRTKTRKTVWSRIGRAFPHEQGAGLTVILDAMPLDGRIVLLELGNDDDAAEALYREVLPLLTFIMQSMDQFLCYGKRLIARRLGLGEVHDRAPAQAPTPFGLACLERHAARVTRISAWHRG